MKREVLLGLVAAAALSIGRVSLLGAEEAEPEKPRTLRRGANCAAKMPKRVAAMDGDQFVSAWNSIFGSARAGRPVPPPEVDFKKEMVLAVFIGEKRTGGYSVEIKSAVEENGKLVVTVSETAPKPDAIVTQALTSPFHLVAVKRSALPVHWKIVNK